MVSINYNYVGYAYQCLCVLATVVLSSFCIHLYYLNEDVARVDYRQFDDNRNHIYPSISLCFGNIFVEEKLEGHGVNQSIYLKFLKGEFFVQPMLSINYRNVTIDPESFLHAVEFQQDFDNGELNPNQTY